MGGGGGKGESEHEQRECGCCRRGDNDDDVCDEAGQMEQREWREEG